MLVSASGIASHKGVEYINALHIQNISSLVTNFEKKNNLSVTFFIKKLKKKENENTRL